MPEISVGVRGVPLPASPETSRRKMTRSTGMTMMSPIPTIWKRVLALFPKKMAIMPAEKAMIKEE